MKNQQNPQGKPLEVLVLQPVEKPVIQTTDTCIYGERRGVDLYVCVTPPDREYPCPYRFKFKGYEKDYCGKMIDSPNLKW